LAPFAQPDRPDSFVGEIDPYVLHRARSGYYGHMTHIDHQLNRFFEVLQEFGEMSNTYICFVSDHGEMMGDHYLFRKGFPYEGSARVPLILKGPASSGIQRGRVCDQVVELRDVMPTLLPVPDTVEGRSFLALAQGETVTWRDYLHGEHTLLDQSFQWLTDGHEKYVWFSGSGREQLFDLDHDPQEQHDLALRPGAADRLQHWRQTLIQKLDGREEGFSDGQQLITGRPVQPCLSHVRPSS
jgi:arylsulfatase